MFKKGHSRKGLELVGMFCLRAGKRVDAVGNIGGGAKYIEMMDPNIDIILIEASKEYYTCHMSNEVLSGDRNLYSLKCEFTGTPSGAFQCRQRFDYRYLYREENGENRRREGIVYDRCIVAPWADFKWADIRGLAEISMPHADYLV